jgi:hypothetical protein
MNNNLKKVGRKLQKASDTDQTDKNPYKQDEKPKGLVISDNFIYNTQNVDLVWLKDFYQ